MKNEYSDYSDYRDDYTDGSYGPDGDDPRGPHKKGGVGKVLLITLGMLILVGIAAAGGYSAHTLTSLLGRGNTEETEDETESWLMEAGQNEAISQTQAQAETESAGAENEAVQETIAPNAVIAPGETQEGSVILTDVSDVVDAVMPSIVAITNTAVVTQSGSSYYGFGYFGYGNGSGQEYEYETESSGSGIIIGQNDTELLIVTNNHVVEDADSLTVQFVDNTTAAAQIKGTKATADIAIVAVQLTDLSQATRQSISIAALGDSDSLRIGQGVIAIGNALGYGQSVTDGIVSALNREVTTDEGTTLTVLQTSAAINAGNSGGALLNASGEVIGINTAKIMETGVEGIGYAIPISSVYDLIEEMMNYETRTQVSEEDAGYLGIYMQTVDSQTAAMYEMPVGVYISSVVEGSPAETCGLQAKDIITAIDQYTVTSASDLQNALAYYAGGDEATLTVERLSGGSYEELSLTVTLAYKRDFVS